MQLFCKWISKLTFYMRTISEILQLLQRLDHVVLAAFIPSITGSIAPSNLEKTIFTNKIFTNKTWGTSNTNVFRVIQKKMQQFWLTDQPSAIEDYKPRKKIRKQPKI